MDTRNTSKSLELEKRVGRFINSATEKKFLQMYDEAMKEWPDSREEIKLETSYGLTHVYSYGDKTGDPIVLLHGANSTSASWANFVVELGEHHRIFAVDTIGDAGRSIQKTPILHSKDYATWLIEVLHGLQLKKVHLIGASYGGWMTLNQAIHSPQLLQSITLLDPARALSGISYRAWPFMLWASIIGPDTIRRAFIRWTGLGSTSEKHQTELVISAMRDFKMQRIPPQYVSDDELKSIKVPTLVLLGEKSPMHNSKRAAVRAKKLLQDVEVEIIPKVGHKLPADIVNDRILKFIRNQKNNFG